jgi:hypothetical protein
VAPSLEFVPNGDFCATDASSRRSSLAPPSPQLPTVISSSGSIKQTALEAAHCTNELGYEFTKRYLKFA